MTTTNSNKPLSSTPGGYPNGYNPNGLANLVKGRARLAEKRANGELTNPAGYSVTAEVKQILKNKTRRVEIAETMVRESAAGNVPMVRELLDRVEGKVEPDKPQYNDNRQYNFIVLGDDSKRKLQQLLNGEKPKTIEATR